MKHELIYIYIYTPTLIFHAFLTNGYLTHTRIGLGKSASQKRLELHNFLGLELVICSSHPCVAWHRINDRAGTDKNWRYPAFFSAYFSGNIPAIWPEMWDVFRTARSMYWILKIPPEGNPYLAETGCFGVDIKGFSHHWGFYRRLFGFWMVKGDDIDTCFFGHDRNSSHDEVGELI